MDCVASAREEYDSEGGCFPDDAPSYSDIAAKERHHYGSGATDNLKEHALQLDSASGMTEVVSTTGRLQMSRARPFGRLKRRAHRKKR